MARLVSRAEIWEQVFQAYANINFSSFDFNTVKQSLITYIQLSFPETFNDFIETDEIIAVVETFAYVAELLAYRADFNANENLMPLAQRADTVLRLAKFISYTPSRPIPARGLVKITSVKTTQNISDSTGSQLSNKQIRWNDQSNTSWKEQFLLVMSQALSQNFGSVSPSDRFQIQDVLFEIYSLNLNPLTNGVFPYKTSVGGQTMPMELVSVEYDPQLGIIERRPTNNSDFTIMYAQDGLGDASYTTGFLMYTKQGTLQKVTTTFDGVTPNQNYTININNINDTDVWVNNINPSTGDITLPTTTLPYPIGTLTGEWVAVDTVAGENIAFNTTATRSKYEINTLANSQIQLLFGDGEFADIPAGTFDIWYRSSLNQNVVIPQASVTDAQASFTYTDSFGTTQTFTFTYSLITSLQNAAPAETTAHVRDTAPSIYYTQNRMVNGQDYNTYPLKDTSILKLRSINRTFAGDSQYITWHDSSNTYENVKIFGTDGMLYFRNENSSVTTPVIDISTLITSYLQPLLSSSDLAVLLISEGVQISNIRRQFTSSEIGALTIALTPPPTPAVVYCYYNTVNNLWYPLKQNQNPAVALSASTIGESVGWPTAFISTPLFTINQTSVSQLSYTITAFVRRLAFQSPSTSFWTINDGQPVLDYSSFTSQTDTVTVLQANTNYNRTGILQQDWTGYISGTETYQAGADAGLVDISTVSLLPTDPNNSKVPTGIDASDPSLTGLADIINPKIVTTVQPNMGTQQVVTLSTYYATTPSGTTSDISVIDTTTGAILPRGTYWTELPSVTPVAANQVVLLPQLNTDNITSVTIIVNEYVYFTRPDTSSSWTPISSNLTLPDLINTYVQDQSVGAQLWLRYQGRTGLNFLWKHYSPLYYLVDPSPTNITDMIVITNGYYLAVKMWLDNQLSSPPSPPTPLDLRTSYNYLLANKMISDTVVIKPGKIKILFGTKADPSLQGTFVAVPSPQNTLTDNQLKNAIVSAIKKFFDINQWEYGETFYLTELIAAIHLALPVQLSSVVLVPTTTSNKFGTLFEITAGEDEIFYPDISVVNISTALSLTNTNINIGS